MIHALMMKFGMSYAANWLKDAADGKKGEQEKAVYWTIASNAVWVGLLLSVACAVLVALGSTGPATWLAGIGGPMLVSAGLLHEDWQSSLPTRLTSSRGYQFVKNHAADVAAGLAYLATQCSSCVPDTAAALERMHLTCHGATLLLTATSAALVHLGLSHEVAIAPIPLTAVPPAGTQLPVASLAPATSVQPGIIPSVVPQKNPPATKP